MRVRETGLVLGVLTALIVISCSKRAVVPTRTGSELNSGNCAGCLLNADDSMSSYVVRTDADYESLMANCFPDHIREGWLPPRPRAGEELVYVSLKGGGCKGCLDIVNIREAPRSVVVEMEGGFQGNCDMLIIPGAWAIIPVSDKPIALQFHEADCPDDL